MYLGTSCVGLRAHTLHSSSWVLCTINATFDNMGTAPLTAVCYPALHCHSILYTYIVYVHDAGRWAANRPASRNGSMAGCSLPVWGTVGGWDLSMGLQQYSI